MLPIFAESTGCGSSLGEMVGGFTENTVAHSLTLRKKSNVLVKQR